MCSAMVVEAASWVEEASIDFNGLKMVGPLFQGKWTVNIMIQSV